ncbi:MAG: benzoyl-CoA 2,3-epoxidase subunit BoxA [Acetobacteraceae bacterium]|nr:benzoyl-CoA 2,3-epoxidase subunit BoxA [Acetobacteraceae bacterium]
MRKQHLIDPETCIRCNTCESRCPTHAITHNADNYVVDPVLCTFCMACNRPCPTGAIDNWVFVARFYTLAEQFGWRELPARVTDREPAAEALDEEAAAILDVAHRGMRGTARAPASASKPQINVFNRAAPACATVTGTVRVTAENASSDVRHIILDFGTIPFPYLEGQSVGVIPPGQEPDGQRHAMRLYSVASARDGERPNTNNMALTVKRIPLSPGQDGRMRGIASNWLCDLRQGDQLEVTGPYGATFLMPDDPDADLLMICTGTGVSPFRGFTHRRRRTAPNARGKLHLVFGARSPAELPYFGPLQNYQKSQLDCDLVYSRQKGRPKEYVQDRLRARAADVASLLRRETTHVYMCGLSGMEQGVDDALGAIGRDHGIDWPELRARMREAGRFHIETY